MSKHLEITLSAANVKRLDCKEYGVTSREAWVKFELAGKVVDSNKVEALTLDPSWDQVIVMELADPETEQLKATFFLGEKQIGGSSSYLLKDLVTNKSTFKGMPVFGGKVDFLFRALDFGVEDKPVEYSFDMDESPF